MSHGLVGMRHRVHSIGGTIDIRGTPGRGTVIAVSVPLETPASA
jgi:two-component system sensor histidine kinase UhpB